MLLHAVTQPPGTPWEMRHRKYWMLEGNAQADHRHEIVEQAADLRPGGRSDQLGGERRDEVAEFRPQIDIAGHGELQSCAHARHWFQYLCFGKNRVLAERLVSRLGAGAAENAHAAA